MTVRPYLPSHAEYVGQNIHTHVHTHNETKTQQVYQGTTRNSKWCVFVIYLREWQQVWWGIFVLGNCGKQETLIAFNSLQRTPYFALESGLSCPPRLLGTKESAVGAFRAWKQARMLLPEAGWGDGESLAVSESCWDLFNIPWSFCQSHLARKPLHNTRFISALLVYC